MAKTILYGEQAISVSEEVAVFLEDDRKRQEAEKRSDRRHISKRDFETVTATAQNMFISDSTLKAVLQNLTHQKLHTILAMLSADEQKLLYLYFYENISMEKIGEYFKISKMAISKRLKKLLAKMRNLMET